MAEAKLGAEKLEEAPRLPRELHPAEPHPRVYPDEIDLLPYIRAIAAQWRLIALVALAAVIVSLLVTTLLMHKTYRAVAILRPRPKVAMENRLSGLIGNFGGAMGSLTGLGIGGGPGSDEAQEYMTIMQSFAFSLALVDQHGLSGDLFQRATVWPLSLLRDSDPRWRAYRIMQRRFSCNYSSKTGNLELYYQDRSRATAVRILDYYVDDLRAKVRGTEVQDASAAIASMKAEARVSPDSLLQQQLYELIAKQMQQLKLAQVQADFAFSVIEPPVAPDYPYRPAVTLDALIAAVIGLIAGGLIALWRTGGLPAPVETIGKSATGDLKSRWPG